MSSRSATASDIEQAKRNAAVARARVQTSVGAVKQKLNPKALAADAAQTMRSKTGAIGEKASSAARDQPIAVGAAAGIALLILFRKPVGKVVRRLFSRRARLERHEYKHRLQLDRDRQLAAKLERRAEKQARRAEREVRKAAKRAAREASSASDDSSARPQINNPITAAPETSAARH